MSCTPYSYVCPTRSLAAANLGVDMSEAYRRADSRIILILLARALLASDALSLVRPGQSD